MNNDVTPINVRDGAEKWDAGQEITRVNSQPSCYEAALGVYTQIDYPWKLEEILCAWHLNFGIRHLIFQMCNTMFPMWVLMCAGQ